MLRRALIVTMLLACQQRVRPPPPPPFDAGPRMDGGRRDGEVLRRDAGPIGATIDGVIDEGEWADATLVGSDVATDHEGSTLTSLRAMIAGDRLFVAIEGTLAAGDSIVLYADRALGEVEGVDPADLDDTVGALDARLSQPSLRVPTGFAMDFAWGTTIAPRTAVGEDAAIGWRNVADDPRAFIAISGEDAPAVCTETACETSILLETLGGAAPRTIALFARLIADTGFTNQTLPEDDPLAPRAVSELLTITEGAMPDAGMPDAGRDAGPPPIVIDGVIGDAEWSGTTALRSSTVAAAPFAGNALRSLRVIRDATTLSVAIEATLTSGNAILMYVDHDVGGPDGAAIVFDDFVGALDRGLSKTFSASELRLDVAWGTLDMPRAPMPTDDRMGWRDVGTDPSFFTRIDAPSACTASGCEMQIALADLGATSADTIGLFVRLGSATTDVLSNQTLPMDGSAQMVVSYVSLPP